MALYNISSPSGGEGKMAGFIIGELRRMGIPYHKRNVNIISVVIDAPGDVISALSGKLGMLRGISSKALYSKAPEAQE